VLQELLVQRVTLVLQELLVRRATLVLQVLHHQLDSQRAVCADQMEQRCVLLVCKGLVVEQLCM
jgi:hypothetical protein